MARTAAEFERVKQLIGEGLSDYTIASITGIPRATVRGWRYRERAPRTASRPVRWEVLDPEAYCYVLGCYLGDGHVIHRSPNSWELRVACDQRYPGIVAQIRHALMATFPESQPTSFASSTGASDVLRVSHAAIGVAFPQHGPGPKHRRAIVLSDWQAKLTHAHPAALIRGLIHTDGCRVVNRFHTKLPSGRVAQYRYVRYFFSNVSADLRGIFVDHCRLLGIRVTQSNHRNLSIAHRDSVAILEQIVGEKT